MIKKSLIFALLFISDAALAQTSPNLTYGQVPTPAQWNSYFAAKQDLLGFPPLNVNGGQMLGPLGLTPSTDANGAGLNVAPGIAPGSPKDGDIWTTTAGIFVRINGVTIGPLIAGNGISCTGTPTSSFAAANGLVTHC